MTQYKNLDAGESLFFEGELEHVKARSYDVLYPELMARRLFPVSSEADPADKVIVYTSYDHVGMAKLIHSYAQDLPDVDVSGVEYTRKIFSEGISFGYSFQDIRASRRAGKSLEQRKANAARRQMLSLENKIAFFGDDKAGIPTFLNNPEFNQYTVPNNAADASALWVDKSPDEILKDINGMFTLVRVSTNAVEFADTLLLPDEHYNLIATTPRSSTSDTTILQFVLNTSPWLKEVIPCYELAGAGESGEDVAIAYRRSPDKLTMEIPQDVEFMPAQEEGLMFKVPVHARTAGVIVYYPKSVCQATGI